MDAVFDAKYKIEKNTFNILSNITFMRVQRCIHNLQGNNSTGNQN